MVGGWPYRGEDRLSRTHLADEGLQGLVRVGHRQDLRGQCRDGRLELKVPVVSPGDQGGVQVVL